MTHIVKVAEPWRCLSPRDHFAEAHKRKGNGSGDKFILHFAGWLPGDAIDDLFKIVNQYDDSKNNDEILRDHLLDWLKQQNGQFAFILELDGAVF
ncbi:MAG: hypothetical protein AAF403_06915, partial [Pseudomonadota bacterium]